MRCLAVSVLNFALISYYGRTPPAIRYRVKVAARNHTKSKIRSRVEHAIGVIKRVFGFTKVRYRAP